MKFLFGLSRRRKRLLLILVDGLLLTFSFLLAMALRLDSFSFASSPGSWTTFVMVLPLTLVLLGYLGLYRAVIRYVSGRAMRTLCIGILGSAILMLALSQILGLFLPRSVPIIYALLAVCFLGGARFSLSGLYRQRHFRQKAPVLIYGAGSSGRQLRASLEHGSEYAPVAFIDDAKELHGREIGGCRIFSPYRIEELIAEHGVKTILLAMPSSTRLQRKAILERLEPLGLRVQTIPGMADIVSGKAEVNEIREVAIEDLLGRDLVAPDQQLLDANIRGKVVLVTGAGGSIGSELCRQIIQQQPKALLLLELSEFALYQIDQELSGAGTDTQLVPLLGSVLDGRRVEDVLTRFKVDTIFHAAAYKHVPLVETNPVEGIRNNVFGTLAIAKAAVAAGVGAFVMVSTDKAVRPTNIMGASKRLAEMICQALAAGQDGTVFSTVRFGNVLGSSGSVVPLFRRQIETGGPITVTHPEITRYFMAIPEAAQLVIQAGAMGRGGDVFILEMGESVKIADLAIRMARLSGLRPITIYPGMNEGALRSDGDIEIRFTQMRPGEKLYEELLIDGCASPTAHPRIFTATEMMLEWNELSILLERLETACTGQRVEEVRDLFLHAPIGYAPREEDVDDTTRDGASDIGSWAQLSAGQGSAVSTGSNHYGAPYLQAVIR